MILPSAQYPRHSEPFDIQGVTRIEPGSGFGELLHLADQLCEIPHVTIGVFEEHRERIKNETGLDIGSTPLDVAFRDYITTDCQPFIVRDLFCDERFKGLSFVNKRGGLRFYAGVSLLVDGETIGTFSAVDTRPRELTPRQIRNLVYLSRQAAAHIELGRRRHQRILAETQLEQYKLNTMAFFKLSTLGEMASGIAHEINNPLAAIMSRAEQLIEISSQERDSRQHTKMIGQQIEKICLRIARTVRSVRNFARDEDLEPMVDVSILHLVETTLDICREKFTDEIALDISMPPDNPTVRCHPIQISQVLLNLLSNAHYAAAQTEQKWVRLEIKNHFDSVEVSVTDSGTGIPVEIRKKIMLPFFTTKPIGQGTGIGLSISKKIIQQHGEELLLDEEAPQTRFVFRLKK